MKDQLMISYEGRHVCQIELIEDTENGDEFVYCVLIRSFMESQIKV